MKDIRILIVEDDIQLGLRLKAQYQVVFNELGFSPVSIEQAITAKEAKDLAIANQGKPYDLVSLDVNLGRSPVAGVAPLTGLDVLKVFKRFRSAWMVSLLTGVETDTSLDDTVGLIAAEKLRKQLRQEAYANFFAERLLVVAKPSSAEWAADAVKAEELLNNRLEQIAHVYREVARQRFIFRSIDVKGRERIKGKKGAQKKAREYVETKTIQWQIRYDCGDLRTLPDKKGFKTFHRLLSMEEGESLTPEAAIALEPERKGKVPKVEASADGNPFDAYFKEKGVDWQSMTDDNRAKLVQGVLAKPMLRYVELRELEDEGELGWNEEEELVTLREELGPLILLAEEQYQQRQEPDPQTMNDAEQSVTGALKSGVLNVSSGGNYDNLREGQRGMDTKESGDFRQTKKRLLEYLEENGFFELAQHLEEAIRSTGSIWSYCPSRRIEWTV